VEETENGKPSGSGAHEVKTFWQEPTNPYEEGRMNHVYMAFHYTPAEEYLAHSSGPATALDFPRRCAQLCSKHHQEGVLKRALDVGCAVGRSSFELAREFEEVVGIDYSSAFIQRCQELKMTGRSPYRLVTEGALGEDKIATVHPDIDRSRVLFMVGDGCALPDLGQFGCVLAANLICRLPDPIPFFLRLRSIVVEGGIVVITSPYSWLEQYTPKAKWLGGYRDGDGNEVRGFDRMREIMAAHFELVEEVGMPFLIRETVRLHQWTVAHATVWRRNSTPA
jgi:putative 4-mercaptohistidine N1-methyltranferase